MSKIDESIDSFLKETMKGYKKIIAQKKCNGIMDVEEGKKNYHLPDISNYVVICSV